MIHARHLHGLPPQNGEPVTELSHRRELFEAVEASLSAVRRAKRAADENLRRVHGAPDSAYRAARLAPHRRRCHLASRRISFVRS